MAKRYHRLTTITESDVYHGANILEEYYKANTPATANPEFVIDVATELAQLIANATITPEDIIVSIISKLPDKVAIEQ